MEVDDKGGGVTRDAPPRARTAFLDAGVALVSHRRTGEVLPGVREVCQKAARSTAVFYGHFENLAAYHDELVDRLLSTCLLYTSPSPRDS